MDRSRNSANLVNNIPLIRVAARYVPTGVEKAAVMKHLMEIEGMTGWTTEQTVKELESSWDV